MKIISVDPGYERLGVAILKKNQSQSRKSEKEKLLFSDCFTTASHLPHHTRLTLLGTYIESLIKTHSPSALAIETLFFSSNKKTALMVSEARGVIIYIASSNNIPVFEYHPNEIKLAITGYGKSDKRSVMSMVEKLITIKKNIRHDDEYDAIAIGLTHLSTNQLLVNRD